MRKLSRVDIENIGMRIFEAYKRLPQLSNMTLYKVDPMILSSHLLELHVDYQHLSLDNSILGLTSFDNFGIEVFGNDDSEEFYILDGKTILIERDLHDNAKARGRYNFTLTHEASHQIFSMLYPSEYKATEKGKAHYYKAGSEKKNTVTDWEEWQANTLASCILMPEELIYQAIYLFEIKTKIKILSKYYDLKTYEKFSCMAELMGCSKIALAIRMKQLGLIEREYLEDPYALAKAEGM